MRNIFVHLQDICNYTFTSMMYSTVYLHLRGTSTPPSTYTTSRYIHTFLELSTNTTSGSTNIGCQHNTADVPVRHDSAFELHTIGSGAEDEKSKFCGFKSSQMVWALDNIATDYAYIAQSHIQHSKNNKGPSHDIKLRKTISNSYRVRKQCNILFSGVCTVI